MENSQMAEACPDGLAEALKACPAEATALNAIQNSLKRGRTKLINGVSFLEHAAFHGNLDAVKFLVANGMKPNRVAFLNAVFRGDLDVVAYLLASLERGGAVREAVRDASAVALSRGHSDLVCFLNEK